MYKKYIKRLLDIVISFTALVLLSPVLLVVAALVRMKLGTPVIFHQERPGKDEKIFTLYKFRTMTDKRDKDGNLLPDSERLTKFGGMLRSTSLDELPELWNVLKGDMALVGPRPLLVSYLPLYSAVERRRHEVRPGITGYAQVKGRNSISWEKKFEFDVHYVDNISFRLDCKIILMTFFAVIKRDGIHSDTSVTIEPFTGDGKV
ncbi:MAG: sugar transferase [Butyrivibrio sp.]|nr:sugar transferase [Butyrivibrio sp.]